MTKPAPRWLWVIAGAVVTVILMPLAYLAWTVVADPAWDLLFSGRTAELLLNTVSSPLPSASPPPPSA